MANDGAVLSRLLKRMKTTGADPLRPLVDAYLLERERAPERHVTASYDLTPPIRPPGRLSPSALCGCERAAVFQFVGIRGRRRVDPDMELIFDDGNWRHLKWGAIFRDMELVLGPERFRVISVEERVSYPELYISGSLDVVVWMRPNPNSKGKKWVIDIKGINSVGFSFLLRNEEPIEKHRKQVITYCRSVGIPRGIIWYENKDNQQTKAFTVRYEEDAWGEVVAWATSVVTSIRRRRLPPLDAECSRGNYLYERCPYAALCYGKRHSPQQLTELAYHDFDDIDAAWERSTGED